MKPSGIAGIGVDIVEYGRIAAIRFPQRFGEYFLTAPEMTSLKKSADPIAFLASRFAAKEAVIKAFPGTLKPHDFTITKTGKKPTIEFLSASMKKNYAAMVSISHSTTYAAGYAIVENA